MRKLYDVTKQQSVTKAAKQMAIEHNVTFNVIDINTGDIVQTHEGHNAATNTLDIWHFGDDFGNAPTLNGQFINETPVNIDRTLKVPSTSQDQFILDLYFKISAIRVMPAYSIPGLLDHH